MANIMKIRSEATALIEQLDNADGEFTTEVAQAFDKLIQDGQAGLAILADVCDEISLRMEARDAKAKEIAALAKKDETVIANTKKVMLAIMDITGQKKAQIGALSITKSDGRESVEVINEEEVPDSYKRATITFPAGQLEMVRTIVEGITSEKVEVSKTSIMDVYKASDGTVGIAGTRIIRKPYLIIKG